MSTFTFTHIVWLAFYWGAGDSYEDAIANAKRNGAKITKRTPHVHFALNKPGKNAVGHFGGVNWEWVDGTPGEFTRTEHNV